MAWKQVATGVSQKAVDSPTQRRARLVVANGLVQLTAAKGIAAGVLGFNHTVSVKENAVARADRHSRQSKTSFPNSG